MKTAYLTYGSANIGDDVQSYALIQELGVPSTFLDRDQLPRYQNDGPIELIANGFFTCGYFPPPPNIKTTYVAMCASNISPERHPGMLEHLKMTAPVGCRDRVSCEKMKKWGVEHYYASCLSILLRREFPYNPEGPVLFIDVDPALFNNVRLGTWKTATNAIRPKYFPTPESRFARVAQDMEALQRARLVVTNRLHVGMPCLGMGVPLVMVETEDKERWGRFRFTALPEQVKIHTKEECAFLSLDPAQWRQDVKDHVDMVRERLFDRLALNSGTGQA